MNLKECFQKLEIADSIDKLGIEWDRSQTAFSKKLPFLKPDFLADIGRRFLDEKSLESVLQSAKRLQKNEAVLRLLWHFHYLIVQNYERYWMSCYIFPELAVLKQDARIFYLLLAFSGASYFGPVHEKRKIPAALLQASISEIRASIESSISKKSLLGIAPHYSGWWQGFFSGRLYRLGRLTFLQEKFTFPYHVFENERHEIRTFAIDGLKFNAQGLSQMPGEKAAFTAEFIETPEQVKGTLISPDGYARKKAGTLTKDEWKRISQVGDPIVSVHISAGEPMDTEKCADSFVQAKAFFEKYFPETRFSLFTCDTWLLDPQYQKVLDGESNIIRFQKRFFLAPNPRDSEFVPIRTIFGAQALVAGYENVPHTTRLQKAAAQLKDGGLILRHGIGFLPWDRAWQETH